MNRSEAGKLGAKVGCAKWIALCLSIREQYAKNPKLCLFCLTPLSFEKKRSKFCNHSCAAKRNNSGINRWNSYTRENRFCLACSLKIEKENTGKFCLSCGVYGKNTSFEHLKTDSKRKKRLIEERGFKCEICNLNEWLGKQIVITLDHIDGNPENSQKSNLRLLCWNCHAMTSTFCGKNVGKVVNSKRKERRKRAGNYR